MDEDTAKVGNSDDKGDSQSSDDKSQQSPDLATIQSRLDGLEKMFQGIQKGNDKVNARVEKRISEALSSGQIGRIAELSKAGKTPEEIENQFLLEELLAERKGKASGATQGNESSGGKTEAQSVLKTLAQEFGLDANDSTVAEAILKNDLKALVGVAKSKIISPTSDATTQLPALTKEKSGGADVGAQLEKEYRERLAKIPRGRVDSVAKLKQEFRERARKVGLNFNV